MGIGFFVINIWKKVAFALGGKGLKNGRDSTVDQVNLQNVIYADNTFYVYRVFTTF